MSNSIRTRGLSEAQAAHYLGVARSTLRQARTTGNVRGRLATPPFIKAGKKVIYLIDDLDRWLEAHRVGRAKGGAR